MFPESDYKVLSMMIAPALFMTATGSLILSSNTRLARIVDRIRVLINQSDAIAQPGSTLDFPQLRLDALREEMQQLHARNTRIRKATALLYMAFALFVGASLAIGIDLFLGQRVPIVPTSLALGGVIALLWACVNLFRETRTASQTVLLEMAFLQRLQAERERARPGSNRRDAGNVYASGDSLSSGKDSGK
jgi:hypothetical protein